MAVTVYRYGHRLARDKRITTHVALTARAFGADGVVIDTKDETVEQSVRGVVTRFGGPFFIRTGIPWKEYFRDFHGTIVHLTMYGQRVEDVIGDIRKHNELAVIVGAEKVPGAFYEMAHYNVAVGNQPHSEVAALAVFLHMLTEGQWCEKEFDGIMNIIPSKRGKVVHYNYPAILSREGCDPAVIAHSEKVRDLAMEIARRIQRNGTAVDMETVEAGALLHDVGRAKTHGIMHIVEGERIAKQYGLPEKIQHIIRNHAGAGIEREEAEKLGLPDGEYMPHTIEEMIVAHADNLTGIRYRPLEETLALFREKAGEKAAEKVKALHKHLSILAGVDIDEIVEELQHFKN